MVKVEMRVNGILKAGCLVWPVDSVHDVSDNLMDEHVADQAP